MLWILLKKKISVLIYLFNSYNSIFIYLFIIFEIYKFNR